MKTTTSEAYKLFCGDLVKNFDKDWFKVGSKLEFGFQFIEHVPEHAWRQMVKLAIDQWDGWPRNWAKAVKEIYELWRRDAGHAGIGIKYDREDDPRLPVNLMQQAFVILCDKGYQPYAYFCDQVSMPKTDRSRVENKYRICTSNKQGAFRIPQIGNRLNPKTSRPDIIPYREFGD